MKTNRLNKRFIEFKNLEARLFNLNLFPTDPHGLRVTLLSQCSTEAARVFLLHS